MPPKTGVSSISIFFVSVVEGRQGESLVGFRNDLGYIVFFGGVQLIDRARFPEIVKRLGIADETDNKYRTRFIVR